MPTAAQKTLLCSYRYDPLDRLVDCLPINQANLQRFYCKSRLASEIQGATQTSIFQHDEQLLAEQRRHGRALDTHLLATDAQRSVLQSLSLGQRQSSAYAPYGHRTAENGVLSLLGFNGERADAVTGHYILGNGYRAFNPVLMRFNSPDSFSPFYEAGLNSYAFCHGNPINLIDPSGHFPLQSFLTRLSELYLNFIEVPFMGVKTKAITDYKSIGDGIYTLTDIYKGKPRLTIEAHGGPPVDGKYPYIIEGKKPITPKQLYSKLLDNDIIPEQFDNIRLAACYSANGDQSFGLQFNQITNTPVKAFNGIVSIGPSQTQKNLPIGVVDKKATTYVTYQKRGMFKLFAHYKPQKFANHIRQTQG